MIVLSNLDEIIPVKCNTEDHEIFGNMKYAVSLDLPWLCASEGHGGIAVIVAGGPSMRSHVPFIKARRDQGQTIFAVNGSANFLRSNGIGVDYFVLLDARAENSSFVSPDSDTHNLISSQCHPVIFDMLKNETVTLWHPNYEGVEDYIGDRECVRIGGGTTVGLQTISIAFAMGYREIHLYGFDSSCSDSGEDHAYPQSITTNDDDRHPFVVAGKTFIAMPWMVRQAMEFQRCAVQLADGGTTVNVHGSGLLPEIAKRMAVRILTAVYDLASSPPTYEFLTFLHEAEMARILGGFDSLDIVFQPGPKDGFRDDDLPPLIEMRSGMLWRVCVAACRLLPSVRNVTVLKEREYVSGEVFPEGWTVENSLSHYGPSFCKRMLPILKPSELAENYIAGKFPPRFICVTLRNAPYWPERNSDIEAWETVANLIKSFGYAVVWIPDGDDLQIQSQKYVCPEAYWDIDLRAALYSRAELSLGVNGGPTVLMAMLDCQYLIFDKPDKSYPCGRDWLVRQHGFGDDPQFSDRGTVIWDRTDTVHTLISEIKHRLSLDETLKIA